MELNKGGIDIKEVPLSIFRLRQLMSLDVGDSSRLPTTSGLRNLSSLELLQMNVDCIHCRGPGPSDATEGASVSNPRACVC